MCVGAHHVWANLTGLHPDPIAMREESRWVVAEQCAECHNPISMHSRTKQQKAENCLGCHRGHDERSVHVTASAGDHSIERTRGLAGCRAPSSITDRFPL